jgi:hypothetical protein
MSNGQPDDLDKTIQEVQNPSNEQGISWLRHKGQACRIDYMILAGATKEEIAANLIKSGLFTKSFDKALHRVQRHIDHLRKEAHMNPYLKYIKV